MPQINQLPTRTPVAGDLVAFFSSANGDAAKTSFTAISTLMSSLLGLSSGGGFITQYSAPVATAFTVVVGGVGQSTWLIITPNTAGFTGTITLPDVATVVDQQELIISTTNDITLSYSASGMTILGAPASLGAGGSIRLKYDLVTKFWHCISVSNGSRGATVNSAAFSQYANATTLPTSNTPIPVLIYTSVSTITGSGLAVSTGSGFYYFSGLNPSNAYNVSFSFVFRYDNAKDIGFSLRDINGNAIAGTQVRSLQGKGLLSDGAIPITITATIKSTDTCVLYMHPDTGTTLSLTTCDASIIECGVAA